jgi:hypothetical protein
MIVIWLYNYHLFNQVCLVIKFQHVLSTKYLVSFKFRSIISCFHHFVHVGKFTLLLSMLSLLLATWLRILVGYIDTGYENCSKLLPKKKNQHGMNL